MTCNRHYESQQSSPCRKLWVKRCSPGLDSSLENRFQNKYLFLQVSAFKTPENEPDGALTSGRAYGGFYR